MLTGRRESHSNLRRTRAAASRPPTGYSCSGSSRRFPTSQDACSRSDTSIFPPPGASLAHEQNATMEKITRYKPPIAFAMASALDRTSRVTYPRVVEYVEREYQPVVTVEDGGEQYLIFTRKDRPPVAGL